MSQAHGTCILVGAGPGHPDLLTVQAIRAIQSATVLLPDDLVSPDILALASPTACVTPVGKRCGRASTPQEVIEHMIISAVRAGETVVRLKGGDPCVFGRGGEELDRLRAAGIAVSVVHGITAGVAAAGALGMPLTHRHHAHGVVFVTGHATSASTGVDWQALGQVAHQSKLTLVIYMGVQAASHIQSQLQRGMPADTPVAIVENASLPQQRHAVCTLATLSATLQQHKLHSPCIIVVGHVLQGLQALSPITPP